MRKLLLAALGALSLAATCKPSPAPPPAPAPSPAVRIYDEFVEAGCIAQDDAGVQAIADEYASYGDAEAWIACLWDGGDIAVCQAPCDSASLRGKLKLRR